MVPCRSLASAPETKVVEPQVDAYLAAVGYLPARRDGAVALHVLEEAGAGRPYLANHPTLRSP